MMKWARGWWILIFCILSTTLKSCNLYFLFYFILSDFTKEIFFLFDVGKMPFLACKQYVSARLDTLLSISAGLGPSIFCRKMEKARFMREEMGWKVVHFPPEMALLLWCFNFQSTFSYLYLDLACKQFCFPPGNGLNRRNESTNSELLRTFKSCYSQGTLCGTDDFNQFSYFCISTTENCKLQFDFPFNKKQSIFYH